MTQHSHQTAPTHARNTSIVDLFVVMRDGSVWNAGNWLAGSPGTGRFGYPIPGAGPGFAQPATPLVALNRSDGVADLFVVRADGSVWNAGHWVNGVPGPGPFGWNQGYPIPGAGPGFAQPGTAVTVLSRARTWSISSWYARMAPSGTRVTGQKTFPGQVRSDGTPAIISLAQVQGYADPGAHIGAVSRGPDVVDLFVVRRDGSVWKAGHWVNGGPGPFGWNQGYPIPGAGPGVARSGGPTT
jgi:hypothetical protein